MKSFLRVAAFIFVVAALGMPINVDADVAPPSNPPGSNPGPGDEATEVRMVAETVVIDVLPNNSTTSLGQAKVTADFTMHNLGTATEIMDVRFPISANDGFGKFPELKNPTVKVDGRSVTTRRIMESDPLWSSSPVPWIQFNVTFPPGEDVQLQVSYTMDGTGEYPFVAYYYVLHTGAGWKDTIGSADLIVRLPYEANPINVIFDEQTGWSQTTEGGVVSGREIRWYFEDLEPDRSSDFQLSIINPNVWQNVLRERSNVEANSDDGEAWGRLGKLYKDTLFFRRGFRHDSGGRQLYPMSLEAYENAVTLKPDDGLWHAGFAELLSLHALYASWDGEETTPEALRSMREINRALELLPNDPKVNEIADELYYMFPDAVERTDNGLEFLWLTATPVARAPIPTLATPTSEAKPEADKEATTLPTKEAAPVPATEIPRASNPICGSILLLPLVFVWLMRRKIHV